MSPYCWNNWQVWDCHTISLTCKKSLYNMYRFLFWLLSTLKHWCALIFLMPEPGWGYTISDTPSARLSSVYIAISELDLFIWWHELAMLLIRHCILALADNLVYPQISLVLFFHDLMTVSYFWWNNKAKEDNCLTRVNTDFFVWIKQSSIPSMI